MPCCHVSFSGGPYADGTPSPWSGHTHRHPCASAAEANAISETTETLHLSPQVAPEYAGPGAPRKPEVCEQSCEELGTMMAELAGLRVVVNELHENLRKVVGAGQPRQGQGAGGGQGPRNPKGPRAPRAQDGSQPRDTRVPSRHKFRGQGGASVGRVGAVGRDHRGLGS